MALLLCSVIAIVWANSPWSHYQEFIPHHWINDGLMTLFFLIVGLEIRHEATEGDLATPKKAMLPIFAALGGMILPALFYFAFNPHAPSSNGWGIPMATDIAFAIAVLAALKDRVPKSLRVFLTALAIVDDIGAILVIAIFYASTLFFSYLIAAAFTLALILAIKKWKGTHDWVYCTLGFLLWYCFLRSGIHATIAGVLFAMAIPMDVGDRLEKKLAPLVNTLIMPLFALANAGVAFSMSGITSSVSMGVIAGLVLGKPMGITLFSWAAVKSHLASIPDDLNWKKIFGAACLGGIGFTVSLFIAQLAFTEPSLISEARLGIILGSCAASAFGLFFLRSPNR